MFSWWAVASIRSSSISCPRRTWRSRPQGKVVSWPHKVLSQAGEEFVMGQPNWFKQRPASGLERYRRGLQSLRVGVGAFVNVTLIELLIFQIPSLNLSCSAIQTHFYVTTSLLQELLSSLFVVNISLTTDFRCFPNFISLADELDCKPADQFLSLHAFAFPPALIYRTRIFPSGDILAI